MSDEKTTKVIMLPRGRLTFASLFEKDIYVDPNTGKEATPKYKAEIAIPKGDKGLDDLAGELLAATDDEFGQSDDELDIDGGKIVSGLVDGDVLAAKKEQNGKKGDAYKGMWVVRPSTIFNLHGQDAPGGIEVWDEAVKPITPANQQAIYSGCYVEAAVVIGTYREAKTNNKAINFYLKAVQKVADGERLMQQQSTSSLFKPQARPANANGAAAPAAGGRRARKG